MSSFCNPINNSCKALTIFDPKQSELEKAKAQAQKALNLFMQRSFRAQIADSHHFPSYCGRGDMIVLAGTSTAGKSTIVKALKHLEPDRIEEDLDLRQADPLAEPRPGAQLEMIDDAIDHSLNGKKVLVHVDQAYKVLQRIYERNVTLPHRTVLAFCPFYELSPRLLQRNINAMASGGDKNNLRDPLMPIDNFATLYTQKSGSERGIERIARLQAINVYNTHFDAMIQFAKARENSLPSDEQIALDKEESRNEFLSKLGFKDGVDIVEIEPRNKSHYTHIFNTYENRDERGTANIAMILHRGTWMPLRQ